MNVLGERTPLYHVKGWAERIPWDLPWREDIPTSAPNDDALGRVLGKLAAHGPAVVGTWGSACKPWRRRGRRFSLRPSRSSAMTPHPTPGGRGSAHYGYSKAHRPDLKQILMSLTSFDMSQARWVVSEGLEPDGIT